MCSNFVEFKKVLVILTDGQSNSGVGWPARQLKNSGVVIFSVGIGQSLSMQELRVMASEPINQHVLTLDNFSQLARLAEQMSSQTCNGEFTHGNDDDDDDGGDSGNDGGSDDGDDDDGNGDDGDDSDGGGDGDDNGDGDDDDDDDDGDGDDGDGDNGGYDDESLIVMMVMMMMVWKVVEILMVGDK